MSGVTLKRLTGFSFSSSRPELQRPETWVNPAQIAYCQPRFVVRGREEVIDGTRLFFQQEAGVLDVREPVGFVVALLNSGGGLCRECFQELPESWRQLCDPCRAHHSGIHVDPEEALR